MSQRSTGGPQRRRATPPNRQPVRRRPQRQLPIGYQEPPIRKHPPALSGIAGGIGLIVLIVVLILAGKSCGGPKQNRSDDTSGALPNVNIEGARPCQLSPKARNDACVQAKTYAKAKLTAKGQANQFDCLDTLWDHESNWNAWAEGPPTNLGRAQGIPQALGKGHVFDLGDWKKQVDWGLGYIAERYKTPCAAWDWWQHPGAPPYDRNWY